MAGVNFPSNRPEANLGPGELQEGDSWRFNSIEYTWVLSPDGTGMWSSKGINVNPELYISKVDEFSGDVTGTYKFAFIGGFAFNVIHLIIVSSLFIRFRKNGTKLQTA